MALARRFAPLSGSCFQDDDQFWSPWFDRLVKVTLPGQWDQIVQTGRLRNFERVAAGETGGFDGYRFNDSDVYKWAEACAYALAKRPDAALQASLDRAIEAVQKAQMPDGYLNTYFQLMAIGDRWRNLAMMHEMYCAGHLIEAGVALAEQLGDRRLLDVSVRFADHIAATFGPGLRKGYCGHQEIELALIKLANATGDAKYRELARWMIETRGSRPSPFEEEYADAEVAAISPYGRNLLFRDGKYSGEYLQDHLPIREHTSVVGHAVRAMYMYIAAADLADGQNDDVLEAALRRCWSNLVDRRMYITGGIGPSGDNEGFTTDFDLPNATAYAETCAAIGLALWGRQMLAMSGDSDFADVVERALFNGCLSGISMAGDLYFYDNPLESRENHARVPWFGCACCPPNIARLIGQVQSFAYGVGERMLWVHFPIGGRIATPFGGFKVTANYPWSGKFSISMEQEGEYAVAVRIPAWCGDATLTVEGSDEEAEFDGGYAVVRRTWKAGETLEVELDMDPQWIAAHPRVFDNAGRLALTRGPVVYAAESTDLGFAPQSFVADASADVELDESGPYPTLTVDGFRDIVDDGLLYRTPEDDRAEPAQAKLVPYFAWNNRGKSLMQVWLRRLD